MWWTRQALGFRGWFHVQQSNGALRTGFVAGDFTVTIRNPANTASSTPAVSESGKGGLYFFDVPSVFLIAQGSGEYGVVIEVDSFAGPSGIPNVRTAASFVLRVSVQDLDTLATSAALATAQADLDDIQTRLPASLSSGRMRSQVEGMDANTVTASALATDAAQEIRDEIQPRLDTLEANIQGADNRSLTEIAGAGFVSATHGLVAADVDRTTIQSSINDIGLTTRFNASIPSLERPVSGSILYVVTVNLEDTTGNPEDPDANTITVTAEDQTGASLSANLGGGGTMTQIASGRYTITYAVSSAHALVQVRFHFSYSENAVAFVKDRSETVVDATEVGFTSADRAQLNSVFGKLPTDNIMGSSVLSSKDDEIDSILADTAAIDARLPTDPADESVQLAAHAATQAAVAVVQADTDNIQTRLPATLNVGRMRAHVEALDAGTITPLVAPNLDAAVSSRATQASVDAISGAQQAVSTTAAAGSTSSEIRTPLTQPDGFFDGMLVEIENAAGTVARRIDQYNQTNGAIFVDQPLPFTPAVGNVVRILNAHDARSGR